MILLDCRIFIQSLPSTYLFTWHCNTCEFKSVIWNYTMSKTSPQHVDDILEVQFNCLIDKLTIICSMGDQKSDSKISHLSGYKYILKHKLLILNHEATGVWKQVVSYVCPLVKDTCSINMKRSTWSDYSCKYTWKNT